MILSKTIKVHVTNKNVGYYKTFYPLTRSGDIIEVDINNLSVGSKQKIEVCCDMCGEKSMMAIKDYNRITNNNTEKYYCNKCKFDKTKKTNLDRYGVENVFQSDEIKEKSKKTSLKKYGVEFYSKTDEHKNKVIKTNIER